MDLLPLQATGLRPDWFPTVWQAVIFRNWGKVPAENLAAVLRTSPETVAREAARLGLSDLPYSAEWRKRGYLTIVRENWYLLSYAQLETLLGIDAKTLENWLYHEDFLYVKLGYFKPDVECPAYSPLTPEQLLQTREISEIVRAQSLAAEEQPFDFETRFEKLCDPPVFECAGETKIRDRIVHAYLGGSGDLLELDVEACFPDSYLSAVAKRGVTGLFIHAVLDQLSRFPFQPERSEGYGERRKVLAVLVERLKKHGLSLYLYFNEPRGLPLSFFESRPELLGETETGLGALCTSLPEVKAYLKKGIRELFSALPGLGGVITITMSENLTNCYSRSFGRPISCPRCKDRTRAEVVAEVNRLIYEGMREAGSDARLIAWNWSWNERSGFPESEVVSALRGFPEGIAVMSNSEEMLPMKVGDVEYYVLDYTVSQSARAPSPCTRKFFELCDREHRRKFAKIQLNNSWECCAAPFFPVFETNRKHLDNLLACGVDGLVLGWTLGGYPSPNMEYFNTRYTAGGPDFGTWLKATYGADADRIGDAAAKLSEAFSHFPFSVNLVYNSPVNIGAANPFYPNRTGAVATMTGYPFDDVERWIDPYKLTDVVAAFTEMCEGLDRALAAAQGVEGARAKEWLEMAEVLACNMKSTRNQLRYIAETDEKNRRDLIENEEILTKKTLSLLLKNCAIGFEASNHYFWNVNVLLEKLVNLAYCRKQF